MILLNIAFALVQLDPDIWGQYNTETKEITINTLTPVKNRLYVYYHEVGHKLFDELPSYQKKIWENKFKDGYCSTVYGYTDHHECFAEVFAEQMTSTPQKDTLKLTSFQWLFVKRVIENNK